MANTHGKRQIQRIFFRSKKKSPPTPGEAGDSDCLSTDKLESQGLVQVGNLNNKALNKKQPKYPYEAKKHKLSGTVIVDVIVDLPSGKIEKTKIRKTKARETQIKLPKSVEKQNSHPQSKIVKSHPAL